MLKQKFLAFELIVFVFKTKFIPLLTVNLITIILKVFLATVRMTGLFMIYVFIT